VPWDFQAGAQVCGPGRAGTLVVRGNLGIGKTVLIDDPVGWYSRRFQVRTQIIADTQADPLALLERL
jgi:hypothetical protein